MLLALVLSAHAGSLAGVTLPDSATVGGRPLALNGMGLREKFTIDVYVAGLYLAERTHDGAAAVEADAPKRVVMHFVYGKVTKEQVVDTLMEGFGAIATGPQKANVDKILAVLPAQILRGEQLTFDYVPGAGTTMFINDKPATTIAGADFMKMLFGVWLGPKPPSAALKAGLLGQ